MVPYYARRLTMDDGPWRATRALLAEVLTRPSQERDAWLARCPDPAVRDEVKSYLRLYDDRTLETALTSSNRPAEEPRELLEVPPGTCIGPYIVLERLGAGGMGQVFLGSDTRLHRKVALKCLISSASEAELRVKLLSEARAAARISHPNIATVHDVVEHDGRAFLVMEYVDGETLAELLRRERLPVQRYLSIGRQLASALTAAHVRGIVHRDLKPGNVQVARDGNVKVLDFGVAQAMSLVTTSTTVPATTAAAVRVAPQAGTPAYMSPEQMLGRTVDQRTDIYSLGVILYEMATGRRPYTGIDPLDLLLALGRRIMRPEQADPTVPRDVSDVITKALATSLDERFQTAAELEAALAAAEQARGPIAPRIGVARDDALATRFVLHYAGVLLVSVLTVALLGFVTTAAFNHTFGRVAPFDAEPFTVWIENGVRSLVAPVVYLTAMLMAVWAARFAGRVLSLSRRVDHLLTTTSAHTRRLTTRLGLDDPGVVAPAVALVGLVALSLVLWRFWDVVHSSTAFIDTAPISELRPLSPGNRSDAQQYRFALTVLVFILIAAIFRIRRLRAVHPSARGRAALAVVVVVLGLTVCLAELPYRTIWRSQFERISIDDERCYVIGASGDEWLVHCPDRRPPRNRVIRRDDASIRRSGVIESIFTASETR